MNAKIRIAHLYPKEMNLYGDTGNRRILEWRLRQRGFESEILLIGADDPFPDNVDIVIGGGGQDAGQSAIQDDLAKKADALKNAAEEGVIMLVVCGLYQLFGRKFVTHTGDTIYGIGILPLETVAGQKRLIGNTVYNSPWGQLVGYENHSGQTFLDKTENALAKVVKGAGNNGQDQTEGCVYNNVFGTYSHGPILSKNPQFADELLRRAVLRNNKDAIFQPLDNQLELQAAAVAKSRPR